MPSGEAGATAQATAQLDRDPAAHVGLEHPGAVAELLFALREAGAPPRPPRWRAGPPPMPASMTRSPWPGC